MRRLSLLLVMVLVVAGAAPAAAENATVAITKNAFVPRTVAVQVGDTVTWTNSDTVDRQIVSQQAGFASPILKPGQTFSFVFTKTGSFRYQDPKGSPTGTVVVSRATNPPPAPPPGTMTLNASRAITIFGGAVRLSGNVSNGKAGETVTILSEPRGEPTSRTDVKTITGGAWTLVVRPEIRTVYRAEWANAKSPEAVLKVRPRVFLRKIGLNRFAASVVATASHAGRIAEFRRWSVTLRRWLLVKRVVLRQSTVDENVAVATFRAKVRKKAKLRIFLPQRQVLPGYVAGYSNFIVA